jgi:hypothetical protein
MSRSVSVPALSSRLHHLGLLMVLLPTRGGWFPVGSGPRAPQARPTHPDHPGTRKKQFVNTPHRADARAHHVLSPARGADQVPMGFSQLPRAAHLSDLERIRAKPTLSQFESRSRRRNFADASASPAASPCLFRRARPLSGILSVEAFTVSRCSLLQRQRLCFALSSA